MAKAPRRLKVFESQLGFYDTVVAAPSQAAALEAWGVRQNLFTEGRARISHDAAAIEAALAHPRTPLRRAIGTADSFQHDAKRLPSVPDMPRRAPRKPSIRDVAAPAPPPADRTALESAEAELLKLNESRKGEEAAFRQRFKALEIQETVARSRYLDARRAATAAITAARKAYRLAAGE